VCQVSEGGYLTGIAEKTHVERLDSGIAYKGDGDRFVPILEGTIVSMNVWGFPAEILGEFEPQLRHFLSRPGADLLKAEFYLPSVVNELLVQGRASVEVLETCAKWFGVTYREDRERVKSAIAAMTNAGDYPERLWESL